MEKNIGYIVVGSLAVLIGILSITSDMLAICGYFPVLLGLVGLALIWAGIANLLHAKTGRDVNSGLKGEKLVKCPECGHTLGTETEIRAMAARGMREIQGMFNPGASINAGTFTTDCPFCHRKIPLTI